MSVKDGILAILTLAPAYGLQLRDEFVARAPHRAGINVGQVYGTLDRLAKAALLESAGETDDGLALYQLTPQGREDAERWLSSIVDFDPGAWGNMLDHVLISASLAGADWRSVIDDYERAWRAEAADAAAVEQTTLGALTYDRVQNGTMSIRLVAGARQAKAAAALEWLRTARRELEGTDPVRELATDRRRRGRPAQTAQTPAARRESSFGVDDAR